VFFGWLKHKAHWQVIDWQRLLRISFEYVTRSDFLATWLVSRQLVLDPFADFVERFKLFLSQTNRLNLLLTRLPDIWRLSPLHANFALASVFSVWLRAFNCRFEFSANDFAFYDWVFLLVSWLLWLYALDWFGPFRRLAFGFRLWSVALLLFWSWMITSWLLLHFRLNYNWL
jgi:hypothetical protein